MWIWIFIGIMIPAVALAIARECGWFKHGLTKYRGVWMRGDHADKIKTEQNRAVYIVGTKEYPRIRYGDEKQDWGAETQPCHDCGAVRGEFHVPGCDVERCPVCGDQAITCNCQYEGVQK
jgi:hypothetical protein